MKKILPLVFGMLLMLGIVPSAFAASTFTSNTTSMIPGSEYDKDNNFGFQINITNITGTTPSINVTDFTGGIFQLGRETTDTFTNYTNNSYAGVIIKNDTRGIWWINFTQAQLGRVEDYNYTWYINNSDNEWNKSVNYNYSVIENANTSQFFNLTIGSPLSGTEANTTVYFRPSNENATGWVTTSEFTGNFFEFGLYRNSSTLVGGTNVTSTNDSVSDTNVWGVETYIHYIYNTSGGVNFTSASKAFNLTMLQNTTNPVRLNITYEGANNLDTNKSVDSDKVVTLTFWKIYSNSTVGLSPGDAYGYYDGTAFTTGDSNTRAVGTGTIKINISGNANYSSNATGLTFYLIVQQSGGSGTGSGPIWDGTEGWCGDGVCDMLEDEFSCQADCVIGDIVTTTTSPTGTTQPPIGVTSEGWDAFVRDVQNAFRPITDWLQGIADWFAITFGLM